jgi:hypothetical protein
MSERENKSGGAGCFIVGAVLLIPVLYMLGIGPAAWISMMYPATEKTVGAAYVPLLILFEQLRPVGEVVDRYIKLWTG